MSAVNADLGAFPPAYVAWGADEMFRDPIRDFVQRLRDSDVEVTAAEEVGMFHVFPILMPWATASKAVYQGISEFTDKLLASAPPLPDDAVRDAGEHVRR